MSTVTVDEEIYSKNLPGNLITTIDELLDYCKGYIKNVEHLDSIKSAYYFAEKMHEGQIRGTGEPYIVHPLNVAYILAKFKSTPTVLIAGLLHDVIEDTEITYEEITDLYGNEIAMLVQGVTKLKNLEYVSKEQSMVENYQKLFLSMAQDLRVAIIKIADRTHNARTFIGLPDDKRRRKAKETMDIYIPIINRLGMYKIKSELEDICFKALMPNEYKEIAHKVSRKRDESEELLNNFIDTVKNQLESDNIKAKIKGRIKTNYSIYKKMTQKNKEFDEIFDLFATRIIVETIADCYASLGIIQTTFSHIPGRIKDYIAVPKPNLYQSVHTTIIGPEKQIIEVQVRTHEMNSIAENGIAAHWAYKEGVDANTSQQHQDILGQLQWYKHLADYSSEEEDRDDFFNVVVNDLLQTNIYVMTPDGRVIDLPSGATPIDFAFKIHTEVGYQTVGAIVNGKIVPLSHPLKTGDVCKINTSKNSFGPSEDWLKFVVTNHAKNKIKAFNKKKNKGRLIAQGKEKVEKAFSARNIPLTDVQFELEKFSKFNIRDIVDIYYNVGIGNLSEKTVVEKYLENIKNDFTSNESVASLYNSRKDNQQERSHLGVVVPGISNPYLNLAKCCMPIPGDEIVGFITKSKGISVHRQSCVNAENSDKNRQIEVYWETKGSQKSYEAKVKLVIFNRNGVLADVISVFNTYNISVVGINIDVRKNEQADVFVTGKIKNIADLKRLVQNLKKIPDVFSVERINN